VHDYFHLYFYDKINKLLQFESEISSRPENFMFEIKNKVSFYMYSNLVNKVMYTYSNMQDWYLRIIQYKKEENKKDSKKNVWGTKKEGKRVIFLYMRTW